MVGVWEMLLSVFVNPDRIGANMLEAQSSCFIVLAEVKEATLYEHLDSETRVELMAILLGLIFAGVGLMVFAWIAARFLRRYAGLNKPSDERSKANLSDDDWWQKPLVPSTDEDSDS